MLGTDAVRQTILQEGKRSIQGASGLHTRGVGHNEGAAKGRLRARGTYLHVLDRLSVV